MIEERPRETLQPTRLDFVLIGSGQVVDKYWLRSQAEGKVNIAAIVSLEDESSFRKRNPNFGGEYHFASSPNETFSHLSALAQRMGNLNIANVASADVRLSLTEQMVSDQRFDAARFFIEKPYATTREELSSFEQLIATDGSRLHFSGKYANGRANILYPHLPEGRTPRKITARIIEGTSYFRIVKEGVEQRGKHQYLIDGPELDLGFHLLDIALTAAFKRFGGVAGIRVIEARDLSQRRFDFERGYGSSAILEVETETGKKIVLDIQSGKADAPNDRSIDFDYGDMVIGQEYTPGDSIDPVYVVIDGEKRELNRHPSGYNYYAEELQPDVFCRQSPEQQALSLLGTRVCMDIRDRRLKAS